MIDWNMDDIWNPNRIGRNMAFFQHDVAPLVSLFKRRTAESTRSEDKYQSSTTTCWEKVSTSKTVRLQSCVSSAHSRGSCVYVFGRQMYDVLLYAIGIYGVVVLQ